MTTENEETLPTVREQADQHIERAKAGIAQFLIDKGVKPAAALKAVADQVRFGVGGQGSILMKRGTLVTAVGDHRNVAQNILPSIPQEDYSDFDPRSDDDKSWDSFEENLAALSSTKSRPELAKERKAEDLDRVLNPDKYKPTTEQLAARDRARDEVSAFI